MPKHDVFISYSRSDAESAERIASSLESHGVDVWLDSKALTPGSDVVQEIEQAMAASSVILLLLSQDYLSSSWANYERALALKTARNRIIPVLIGDVAADQLPSMWKDVRLLDASESSDRVVREIEKKISESSG